MKIKPIYIYLPLAIIAIVFLVIVSQQNSSTTETTSTNVSANEQMPKDDIHKDMQAPVGSSPSKANVNENYKHQVEMLEKEIKEHPNDTLKLRQFADLITAGHRGQDAIQYYNRILKIDPKRRDIYFALTFIYYSEKNFDKAEDLTKKVLDLYPQDKQALYNLGAIAFAKGNKKECRTIWEKLIKDFPNSEAANQAKTSLEKL